MISSTFRKVIDLCSKKISSFRFKKKLRKEKLKLYAGNSSKSTYKKRKNKFRIFKAKLEFENTPKEIKKISIYYYSLGFFLIASSVYVLFFSHYFSIKSIDIINKDETINIDLSYKSIEDIRYKPILIENKEEIKNKLIAYQPNIKEVYIRKILPDNIKIVLSSYKSVFWFEREGKTYNITENGVVVPAKNKNGLTKINIKNADNPGIMDYKKVFKPDYISKIGKTIRLINEKNSFVKINELNYYKKESELHIVDKNGAIIIFDLNKEPEIQVEKLNIFYKEYLSRIKSGIIYIDLRIRDRIHYCTTDNEFQCRMNLKNIYD